MKRTLIIIRSCMRDDFIARHCYESWTKLLPDAHYVFFLEKGTYKYVPYNAKVVYRRNADNFGGELRALPFIEDLRTIDTEGFDYVAVCDADVEMFKNPFEKDFLFGGIQDDNNPRHFSGQLLMYRQDLFDIVIKYPYYSETIKELQKEKISIADDTLLSYVSTTFTHDTHAFNGEDYWKHDKLYHLEPK